MPPKLCLVNSCIWAGLENPSTATLSVACGISGPGACHRCKHSLDFVVSSRFQNAVNVDAKKKQGGKKGADTLEFNV